MSRALFTCAGGTLALPDRTLVLVDRLDGGNLVVNPPREVWERSELTPGELTMWSFLIAASGRAMLDVLPQLNGGCINYWEAGNWALNDAAEPPGPKRAHQDRRVHLHLLGRSRTASDPSWRWGEAPTFPNFADRHIWASRFARLTVGECGLIVTRVEALLAEQYGLPPAQFSPSCPCPRCEYPTPTDPADGPSTCSECR